MASSNLSTDVIVELTLEVGMRGPNLALEVDGRRHLHGDVRADVDIRFLGLALEVAGHGRGQDVALGGRASRLHPRLHVFR